MRVILLILAILLSTPAFCLDGADVGIYISDCWEEGKIALESFLSWKNLSYEGVSYLELNSSSIIDLYEVFLIPGGSWYWYNFRLNSVGKQHIRDFVINGGSFIGICGGAMFACDSLDYEGELADPDLDLFAGKAFGKLNVISSTWNMTYLSNNANHPINQFLPESQYVMYAGGSTFFPYQGTEYEIVTTYDEYLDLPSALTSHYGSGKLLLIGPHPEFEEDSTRDNTNFGDNFEDLGSDWGYLWASLDWSLNQEITDTLSVNETDNQLKETRITQLKNFPNPFNPYTTISFNFEAKNNEIIQIEIYNLKGQKLRQFTLSNSQSSITWDGKNQNNQPVASGIYYYQLIIDDKLEAVKRCLLLK